MDLSLCTMDELWEEIAKRHDTAVLVTNVKRMEGESFSYSNWKDTAGAVGLLELMKKGLVDTWIRS